MAKWVYRSITKYAIVPEFGSVENFMRAIIRLKREGEGFCGLVRDNELTLEKVKVVVPDDLELHKLADILSKIDTTKDCLDLRFDTFRFDSEDQLQTDRDKRWSSDDQVLARKIFDGLINGNYLRKLATY